jgi:DNA polymerase-3 subunit gamma/tau
MPTSGRFKVYLIDEVHMLSRQSFNALLKTLEEPPPHVKFLFATTDPQKLPVTVLSRCLQFNLKRLSTKQIVDRMSLICAAEGLEAEQSALVRLGRAASGSMRDGLSLLDQARAYGGEKLVDDDVAAMLGSMDRHRIVDLLQGLAGGDGAELLARIRQLDELVPDYGIVLDELASALQRIAVIQLAGADAIEDEDDPESLCELAGAMERELVQLFYQIAITSRRDLGLAPDPRIGFEMALLRMLAFTPANPESATASPSGTGVVDAQGVAAPKGNAPRAASGAKATSGSKARRSRPADDKTGADATARGPVASPASPEDLQDWPRFVAGLTLDGAARQLAENSAFETGSPFDLRLRIQRCNEHLLTDNLKKRLVGAVQEKMGSGVKVHFRVTDEEGETTAARAAEQAKKKLSAARESIEKDPKVRELVDLFGGEVVAGSVQPVRGNHTSD